MQQGREKYETVGLTYILELSTNIGRVIAWRFLLKF